MQIVASHFSFHEIATMLRRWWARPLRSVFSNATRLILPLLAVIRTNQSKTNLIGSFFCFLGKNNRTCGNRRLPTNYVCNLHCVQLTRLVRCTSIAITLAYSLQVLSSVPTVRCKLLHRIFRFTKSQLCCAVGGLVRCARFSQMLRA